MKRRSAIKNTVFVLGGVLSASTISTVFQNCVAPDPEIGWKPSFFSVEQGQIIEKIADILIPATDTPGAVDALVPQFVDLVVKKLIPEDDQKQLLEGFTAFEAGCNEANGQSFLDCSAEQQLSFLQAEEKSFIESSTPSFFGAMKEMIYRGFFNSEAGATEVLKFDPVPGNYDGCVPFSEINGAWAT